MASTLITSTFGGSANDAYVSLTEADSIAAVKTLHNSFWKIQSDSDKDIALRMAAISIDSLHWQGDRLFTDQALRFPSSRDTIRESNATSVTSFSIDIENQEKALKDASVHQAISILLGRGKLNLAQVQVAGVRSISGGAANTAQAYGLTGTGLDVDRQALRLMQRWRSSPRLVRG